MKMKFVSKKHSPQGVENNQVTETKVSETSDTIGQNSNRAMENPANNFMRRRMGVAFGVSRKYLFPVGQL
jgi:hypothetical protein